MNCANINVCVATSQFKKENVSSTPKAPRAPLPY